MIASRNLNPLRVLVRPEVCAVLSELERRARRSIGSQMNLVIFRLACCCGLRVSEVAGLMLSNIRTSQLKPHIRVPQSIAKRQKQRIVPLWLDRGTLEDLKAWKAFRESQGATGSDPLICNQRGQDLGKPITTRAIEYRFKTLLRHALEPERVEQLSIHSGRHSFCSHLLAAGFTLAQVRDWAGHSSISTTSIYLHADLDPSAGEEILESFDF